MEAWELDRAEDEIPNDIQIGRERDRERERETDRQTEAGETDGGGRGREKMK